MIFRLLLALLPVATPASPRTHPPGVEQALAAEARFDSARALELFLEANRAHPDDPFILQKIAQQYSDLIVDLRDIGEKKRHARLALEWSERAVARDPDNPVNVLSLAICHGKLATYSDPRTKVRLSRRVKEEAERALALGPDYAWAHHVLGRWHREVAELGGTARFFVNLFYGGLPDASDEQAVAYLRRAVELEPAVPSHWIELGFAQAAAGLQEEAQASWRRGLELPSVGKHDDPAKARARRMLAS